MEKTRCSPTTTRCSESSGPCCGSSCGSRWIVAAVPDVRRHLPQQGPRRCGQGAVDDLRDRRAVPRRVHLPHRTRRQDGRPRHRTGASPGAGVPDATCRTPQAQRGAPPTSWPSSPTSRSGACSATPSSSSRRLASSPEAARAEGVATGQVATPRPSDRAVRAESRTDHASKEANRGRPIVRCDGRRGDARSRRAWRGAVMLGVRRPPRRRRPSSDPRVAGRGNDDERDPRRCAHRRNRPRRRSRCDALREAPGNRALRPQRGRQRGGRSCGRRPPR